MATASIPVDLIEKELTCSICLSLLQDPKILDCPHTFCFDCLKQYVQKSPTIERPECRHITVVPQGTLTKLKTNLRLKNMVENFIKGTDPQYSKKQMEVPLCPDHIGERQHFFCVTCSVSVCHNCLVVKHPNPQHEVRERKEIMEEDEKQRRQKKQELDDVERKLKSAKDKAKKEVKSYVQRVTSDLETWEKKMNENIETTYQKRIKILQEKQIELDRSARPIGRSRSAIGGINKQDDALLHDMTILHFEPEHSNSSNFGKLVTSGSAKNKTEKQQATFASNKPVEAADKKLSLTFLTEFGDFNKFVNPATDVAANQSNLIAVANVKTCVDVYRNRNGKYKQQCQFQLKNQSRCVAISSQSKFFVTDGGVVKVFSMADRHERSWDKPANAYRIAITPDDKVVIASRVSPDGERKKYGITVHLCDGRMIRRYKEEYDTMKCIASNGKQIAFIADITLWVIDFVTGDALWTMRKPFLHDICYEQNSGTLLVSGGLCYPGQGVIEQFCSKTGRFISCLASGLIKPWGMTVTQDNKLVVADRDTVKIYNIN